MLGHPGGEKHSRYLIELSFLEPGSKWLDMGAGDGETVRLLRSLGYSAEGIDLEPRGKDVFRGNFLDCPWQEVFFDGIISQCSFYVSENVPGGLREASRLLRKGGKLVFSDVTENVVTLLNQCREAHFAVRHLEDLTDDWKEYYLEALWKEDNVCLPQGKKFSYVLFVCEKIR
ncbi:MAG: class I SAM-dependent methyltransferase [Oscillospiraceae bacterium]|nr:class I SAM-dependent methyltransferase [Oscillospiraceae bacterium]